MIELYVTWNGIKKYHNLCVTCVKQHVSIFDRGPMVDCQDCGLSAGVITAGVLFKLCCWVQEGIQEDEYHLNASRVLTSKRTDMLFSGDCRIVQPHHSESWNWVDFRTSNGIRHDVYSSTNHLHAKCYCSFIWHSSRAGIQ